MNDHSNTNWNWSVTGIAIRDNTVLLARHTYGGGKGKWIVPGGYLENGESPADAVKREFVGDLAADLLLGASAPLYTRLYDEGLIESTFSAGCEGMKGLSMFSAGGDSRAGACRGRGPGAVPAAEKGHPGPQAPGSGQF